MPTTSPFMLNSGPPELPGLIATSVWMNGTRFSCGRSRPFALTMPAVIVFSRPNGLPIATTHSPTLSLSGSPMTTRGRSLASIFSSATSVRLSVPTTLAMNSRLSDSRTVTSVGFVDDVRVGDDVAVAGEDEAGSGRLRLELALLAAAGPPRGIWPKRRKNS